MISSAKTVTAYLHGVPEERKEALCKLRIHCKESLIGYDESMAHGGPTYKGDKGIEIGFASQRKHIHFYCLVHQVMIDNQEQLKGLNHGKGVIRVLNPDKIEFDLIRRILKDTVESGEKPC
jgi:uncharacterized protein YdhG (YjbR/CyaY superfamily)